MPSLHTRQVFGKTRMVQRAVLAQVLQACPPTWLYSEGELWGRGVDHHGSDFIARLAQCWVPNLGGCWKRWKLNWKSLLYHFNYFMLPGKLVNKRIYPHFLILISITFYRTIW